MATQASHCCRYTWVAIDKKLNEVGFKVSRSKCNGYLRNCFETC
jgi:hypothetical protein